MTSPEASRVPSRSSSRSRAARKTNREAHRLVHADRRAAGVPPRAVSRSVLRARQRKKPSAPTTRAEALRRMGNTRGRAAAPSASPWRVLHSPSPLYAHPPVGEQHRQYDQQQKQQGFIHRPELLPQDCLFHFSTSLPYFMGMGQVLCVSSALSDLLK